MIWLTNWKKYSNIFSFFYLRLLWSVQSLKSNPIKRCKKMNKETKIKIKKIIDEYVGFAQQVPTLEPNDLSLEKVV